MSELRLDGDVAIVTGAGRGIGRSHALELARRGARVVVNDLDAAPVDEVVAQIRANGGEAVANLDNVASAEGGAALVAHALETFGDLHVVVNNAGIVRDKSFQNMTDDFIDPVLAVHLKGAFNVTVPAWRHFKAAEYGRIVNTTSASGMFGNIGQTNYGAAKAGLYGLTRNLSVEGRKLGILVNAVSPMAATRMNEDLLGDRADLLHPSFVSPVVAFLASRECTLTGQVLSAGGGHVAAIITTVTRGFTDRALSAEVVRDSIDQIMERDGSLVPRHIGDELGHAIAAIEAASG